MSSLTRLPYHPSGRSIGLLGGSFNPAHAGHVYISREALKRLHLDEVWWLVSPQNPLKPSGDMAPFDERFDHAQSIINDRRIKVLNIEQNLGTQFTADTLKKLRRIAPGVHFVWMMGADNLVQFHQWHQWQGIVQNTAIAVFDRRPYSRAARSSKTARTFKSAQKFGVQASTLSTSSCPAWCFFPVRHNLLSATDIRRQLIMDMNN